MEVPKRVMHLTFSVEDPNGNDITCPVNDPSPDSLRTNSSLSHGSTDSPDDVEMADDCVSEENLVRKVIIQSENMAVMDFVTTDGNCNQQNDSRSVSAQFPIVYGPYVEKNGANRDSGTRLDSVEQDAFVLNSVKISRCNSETCSSVSSGEMVVRNNSFIIHESEPQLSVSLLEESLDVPSDIGMMPGLLPDVCEGLVNNMVSKQHQELGITFIQPSNQTFIMEEEVFQGTPDSLVSRGVERKSSHLIPGVDRTDCVTPINWNKSNTEAKRFLSHTGGSLHSTPADGKTFHLPNSDELDISGNAQTSTPVQSLGSKTFCIPSLSDSSPSKGGKSDLGSPMAHIIKEQPVSSVLRKPRTPMTAPPRSSKPENKRFAKPDFSNVKSKVVTRPSSASKLASVSGVKVSSNISHPLSRNQSTKSSISMQQKISPTKSACVSSNPTNTSACNSLKKIQSTVGKRVRSATCQEEVPAPKSRPRTRSEMSNSSKTTTKDESDNVKEVRMSFSAAKGSSVNVVQNETGIANHVDKSASSGEVKQVDASLSFSRKPPKTTPKTPSSRLAEPAPCDWGKGRPGSQSSSTRAGGVPAARGPAANSRQPSLPGSKLKPGTAGKNGCATTDMPTPRSKPSTSGGIPKMRLPEGTGAEASGAVRPRFSATAAHPQNAALKLPVKPRAQLKSAGASNGHTKPEYVEASSGVFGKPPTNRATSVRTRLQSLPPRAQTSGCRNTTLSSQTSVRSSPNVLKTSASPRYATPRLTGASSVDKGKVKTTARSQQQSQTNGHPDLVPPETKPRGVEYFKALCEKKNQSIQHLKNSLIANNCRFEALTVVVQNLSAEHEEAVKRRQELCRELLNLREELVSSAQSCERLEQEKEDLRVTFDGVLQKVQEQHRSDLADLEERLKTFYSAEWEKVHQTYQDEANKCKAQMEQQLEELKARYEDLKQELELSHGHKVESLKQHYEESFEELRKSHELEMNSMETKLQNTETTLSNQIEDLSAENCLISERLKAEEDRRKELAEKCQKDSHTLYLEQELESLKVVLDIKNKQIHQQDKKLMQMDKLLEKNVKLDECLKKVQQENEDLKARMDRHAALSRQLSTEQTVLQESLQKETKVNKRLSMENEELLWKLHNGDLSSPRKTSPSSPSITLQSPRNSGLFSSPPLSPR